MIPKHGARSGVIVTHIKVDEMHLLFVRSFGMQRAGPLVSNSQGAGGDKNMWNSSHEPQREQRELHNRDICSLSVSITQT